MRTKRAYIEEPSTAMATYRMANVWRDPRTGICYFRRGVPVALRSYLGGRWELKVSLRTKDPKVAKQRYPIVAAQADRRLEEARRTHQTIQQQDQHDEPVDLPPDWLQWHYAQQHGGAVGDPALPPVDLLDPEPPLPLRTLRDASEPPAPPLMDLIDWWAAERQPPRKTLQEWTRVVTRLQGFLDAREEGPSAGPEGVSKKDVVQFKDNLLEQGRSPKTVKNHLNVLHALWASAMANERVTRTDNPAHGVRVAARKDPADRRQPYSDEDARTILRATRGRTGARRWVPWLLLFTGARIDEICQLDKADVRHDAVAGWYLQIHHGDPGEGRHLKNLGSERRVPLHRQVVAEGFCEWVSKRPDGTLWPDLKPDTFGSRGGTASKVLGRWVRSLGITDPRKVLHSARHRYKDLCRGAEIPKDQHDALTGHTAGDVGSSYGLGYPLVTLRRAVDRIPGLVV
jgi:integrase